MAIGNAERAHVVSGDGVQELTRIGATYNRTAHVTYVEDSYRISHSTRFLCNPLEPEWKAETCELYDMAISFMEILQLNAV
jgi:hypothetical protein